MKKNFIIFVMLIAIVFSLVGCGGTKQLTEEDFEEASKNEYSMFIKVENTTYYDIVYHKTTRVMYAISRGGYNQGTFTVLLNADGTPMLYKNN